MLVEYQGTAITSRSSCRTACSEGSYRVRPGILSPGAIHWPSVMNQNRTGIPELLSCGRRYASWLNLGLHFFLISPSSVLLISLVAHALVLKFRDVDRVHDEVRISRWIVDNSWSFTCFPNLLEDILNFARLILSRVRPLGIHYSDQNIKIVSQVVARTHHIGGCAYART